MIPPDATVVNLDNATTGVFTLPETGEICMRFGDVFVVASRPEVTREALGSLGMDLADEVRAQLAAEVEEGQRLAAQRRYGLTG